MAKVSSTSALHVRVARKLREIGYRIELLATGHADDGECTAAASTGLKVFTVLSEIHRFWWLTWTTKTECHVATVWLKHHGIGATRKNWLLHVYGRQLVGRFNALAHNLSADFNVDVHVRLENDSSMKVVPDFND